MERQGEASNDYGADLGSFASTGATRSETQALILASSDQELAGEHDMSDEAEPTDDGVGVSNRGSRTVAPSGGHVRPPPMSLVSRGRVSDSSARPAREVGHDSLTITVLSFLDAPVRRRCFVVDLGGDIAALRGQIGSATHTLHRTISS